MTSLAKKQKNRENDVREIARVSGCGARTLDALRQGASLTAGARRAFLQNAALAAPSYADKLNKMPHQVVDDVIEAAGVKTPKAQNEIPACLVGPEHPVCKGHVQKGETYEP